VWSRGCGGGRGRAEERQRTRRFIARAARVPRTRTVMPWRPYRGRVRGGHPWVVPGADAQNGAGARGASLAQWRWRWGAGRSLGFGRAAGLAGGPAGAVRVGLRGPRRWARPMELLLGCAREQAEPPWAIDRRREGKRGAGLWLWLGPGRGGGCWATGRRGRWAG
jgi:hypothetical protein